MQDFWSWKREASKMSRALFVIGGFGLGNSTRCAALIEELNNKGMKVDVATSSNGLWYFADSSLVENVFPLAPLQYSRRKNRISFLRSLLSMPIFLIKLITNAITIVRLQRRNGYSFIATDSEYSPFLAKLFLFTPLVSINNVFFTFSNRHKRFKDLHNMQYWPALILESIDLLIQKYFSDYRIAPILGSIGDLSSDKTFYCRPLVRRKLYQSIPSQKLSRGLVVASGSGVGVSKETAENLAKSELVNEVLVLGLEGISSGKIRYLGRQKDISKYMAESDFLVSNGGFSTISEALVCGRPVLLIPIKNHFEQTQNAHFVESAGFGVITSDETIEHDLKKLTKCDISANNNLDFNGAEQAASALVSLWADRAFSFTRETTQHLMPQAKHMAWLKHKL